MRCISRTRGALCALALLLVHSRPAAALDKQGSAHGGSIEGASTGVALTGSATLGVAIFNPTFAARPDNSGLALMRYAGHLDLDLIGRRLSIPLDVNLFSDREARGGARKFVPSELDIITGVTSTFGVGPGALELGVRGETDQPLDNGGYEDPEATPLKHQTYLDARARYLYSVAAVAPGLGDALGGGDITGWATLGWFAINPTYAARPDNTGKALLRYAFHTEVSFWKKRLAVGLDAILFTDRRESNVLAPTELDFTPELIGRAGPFELHVAYERDMPIDRGGLVQHFLYANIVWAYEIIPPPEEPASVAPPSAPPSSSPPPAPSAPPESPDAPAE